MRIKPILIAGAALAIALPAIAQQAAQTQSVNVVQGNVLAASPQPSAALQSDTGGADESAVEEGKRRSAGENPADKDVI